VEGHTVTLRIREGICGMRQKVVSGGVVGWPNKITRQKQKELVPIEMILTRTENKHMQEPTLRFIKRPMEKGAQVRGVHPGCRFAGETHRTRTSQRRGGYSGNIGEKKHNGVKKNGKITTQIP